MLRANLCAHPGSFSVWVLTYLRPAASACCTVRIVSRALMLGIELYSSTALRAFSSALSMASVLVDLLFYIQLVDSDAAALPIEAELVSISVNIIRCSN